jgi:hypothetical protein
MPRDRARQPSIIKRENEAIKSGDPSHLSMTNFFDGQSALGDHVS